MSGKIHPSHIGFDIDGVVADTSGAFIRMARDVYGFDEIDHGEITTYMFEECLDIDKDKVDKIFSGLLTHPLDCGLEPMPNAINVLNELAETAPLTFITARPDGKPIEDWLRTFLSPEAARAMRLIAMGEHDGKAIHIKKMGLQYFIDDRAETCIRLAEEGLSPIVFKQPWNSGRHRLPEVDNWTAVHELCAIHAT